MAGSIYIAESALYSWTKILSALSIWEADSGQAVAEYNMIM